MKLKSTKLSKIENSLRREIAGGAIRTSPRAPNIAGRRNPPCVKCLRITIIDGGRRAIRAVRAFEFLGMYSFLQIEILRARVAIWSDVPLSCFRVDFKITPNQDRGARLGAHGPLIPFGHHEARSSSSAGRRTDSPESDSFSESPLISKYAPPPPPPSLPMARGARSSADYVL